jgi:hypothetical protein
LFRALGAAQNRGAFTGFVIGDGFLGDGESGLGVMLGECGA